jgi:hypothetical protein
VAMCWSIYFTPSRPLRDCSIVSWRRRTSVSQTTPSRSVSLQGISNAAVSR